MTTARQIEREERIQTDIYWVLDCAKQAGKNQQSAPTLEQKRMWARIQHKLEKIAADTLAQL